MTEEKRVSEKAKRKLALAASMLMFSSHRYPGVRGWELRRRLGKNYLKVVDALNNRLATMNLRVKVVFEQPLSGKPEQEDFDRARFFVTLSEPLSVSDVVAAGWSIDDVAILSAAASYVYSKGGKAHWKEVVELLEGKFPPWKVEATLERFVRRGYLMRSEENVLSVGWRMLAEIDEKELLKSILDTSVKSGSERQVSGNDAREPQPNE